VAIAFSCTNCGQKLRIEDDWAGRPAVCPRCKARLVIPHPARPKIEPPPAGTARESSGGPTERPLVAPAKKIDFEDLIDMTAMVDIVFFLLIFFLVTSMHALDSSIPMPAPDPQKAAAREQRSLAALEADDEYIIVRIDRHDTISLDGAEMHNDRDLLFKLRELRLGAGRPDKMLVVGHGDASHGTVVMVLDAGRDVGIEQVRLAVADE